MLVLKDDVSVAINKLFKSMVSGCDYKALDDEFSSLQGIDIVQDKECLFAWSERTMIKLDSTSGSDTL